MVDLQNPPDRFWHCRVQSTGEQDYAIVNDLTFAELRRSVIEPWLAGRPFTISGKIIRAAKEVKEIQIAHTPEPQQTYADRHNAEMRSRGILDGATNRKLLPFRTGEDVTFALLFEGAPEPQPAADIALVERLCSRLPQAARILAKRQRRGKALFEIFDEYDVQDLLHAVLRAYLKYSVQEDPIPKAAETRSGRADISVENLGLLIEVKYVRAPDDQRRILVH